MKAFLSAVLFAALAAALVWPVVEYPVYSQAPSGPQGGAQPQQKPASPAQSPSTPQQPAQAGVTIAVDVPIVTLDVVATTQHGDILTGLKKENFRVLDDGVAQTITNFGATEAPITIVMLMEFSSRGYYEWFAYQAKYWADAFFPNLQQKDWVALVTFDMKTRLEQDFTQNKDEVRNAIYHLYFPGFSESNVFDAILETVDRLNDVTIFAVGLDRPYINFLESRGYLGSHLNYLQGENQLRTFAQETGGYAWFPQFDGEIPGIFRDVAGFLRHQYSLSFSPSNGAKDGKFHKVKVELVAPDGGPLTVVDQKGKKQKYQVYARQGYQAPKGGVGD